MSIRRRGVARRTSRPVLGLLTALTVGAGLAACSSSVGSAGPGSLFGSTIPSPSVVTSSPTAPDISGNSSDSSAPPVETPTASPVTLRYVALGDSYTAAPLVPNTDTSDPCLRSSNNYPALVARAIPGTALSDVSCSGAASTALVGPQGVRGAAQPPQYDALTRDTDLVTIGLGGNDFSIFNTLVGTCAALGPSDPTGSPCRDRFFVGGSDSLAPVLDGIALRLQADIEGIQERSPQAVVIAVGYPQLVPAKGSCFGRLPVARGDLRYVRAVAKGLSDAVQSGARKAGVQFLDLAGPSRGHDICAVDPWINGIQTDAGAALAFHPFANEQQAVARLVLARVRADGLTG